MKPAAKLPRIKITANRSAEKMVRGVLSRYQLHTVCRSAKCPNINECFSCGTATFMILGNRCTRGCLFCGIRKHHPVPLDPDEPNRVAAAASELGLRYIVITSVTRDDLDDGGAGHFNQTIQTVRKSNPEAGIEVLVPDFQGDSSVVDTVLNAAPRVFNHNLETIRRLYPAVRPAADYVRSLNVLRQASRDSDVLIKSGIMVGLGEKEDELKKLFQDVVNAGVQILTIGQYLSPTGDHYPVQRIYAEEDFARLENLARKAGLAEVVSGTYVRSSYRAGEICARLTAEGRD